MRKMANKALQEIASGHNTGVDKARTLIAQLTEHLGGKNPAIALANLARVSGFHENESAHALNTSMLAILVGQEMNLPPAELHMLGLAGLLHDVGEYRMEQKLRYKPGLLSGDERMSLQRHPEYGKELLRRIPGLSADIALVVLQHHEQQDGSGYPHGLREDKILPLAQILRVVDEYTYLINHPDRGRRRTPHGALSELYVARRKQLSEQVIIALVRVLSVYPPGTIVQLSDGNLGLVMTRNRDDRWRPLVTVYPTTPSDAPPYHLDLDVHLHIEIWIEHSVEFSEVPAHVLARMQPYEVIQYLLL
jgi:HD-GYP domain-containing protein (c-di-GMP phosphodiesterase class II)